MSTTEILLVASLAANLGAIAGLLIWNLGFFHNPNQKQESPQNVCPECNQPNGKHLIKCTMQKLKENTTTEREPHCSICGQPGHYAKKCPNQKPEEKQA